MKIEQVLSLKEGNSDSSTEKMITPLIQLGLNRYEAQVYFSLITEGVCTAKNISDITGIPYGKVYEIINSLSAKGFCVILPSKPLKCRAISPEHAFAKTKQDTMDNLQKIQENITSRLMPIFEQTKQFVERGAFWAITGRSNIIRKIQELIVKSEQSVFITTTENGMKRLSIFKRELEQAKKRGVTIKISAPLTKNNQEDQDSLKFCEIVNEKVVKVNYFSFDAKHTIVADAVPDDESFMYGRDNGILIQNSDFANFMEDAFLTKWDKKE